MPGKMMTTHMTTGFKRELHILKSQENKTWDFIIIGGGATGLGIALDAASRGFSTLLLEQSDFAKGTSSRSTKLIHGGVRYLAQGNLQLVYTALHERGILFRNAKHLISRQSFVIPCYNLWSRIKYYIGLKIYDWISGNQSLGPSKILRKEIVQHLLPVLSSEKIVAGIEYFDGHFDDARLALNLAQTCSEMGAVICNYVRVTGLNKQDGKLRGVSAIDLESGNQYNFTATVVVNATGVFVDDILQMDLPGSKPIITASQGIHMVVDHTFLNSSSGVMIPKTSDGRVLFALPWHHHVLIGTTDTPIQKNSIEPRAMRSEVDFIFKTLKQYWTNPPQEKDVLSVFAGLRPLTAPQKHRGNTKEIPRDHKLLVAKSGLVTITGGKWTTYRKMAEATVDKAIQIFNLRQVACKTKNIKIHGYTDHQSGNHFSIYGSDESQVKQLITNNPMLSKTLCDRLPYTQAEVVWGVRNEMARTIEDVLARRIRILFLDVSAAISAAPVVAQIIAKELEYDEEWQKKQVLDFISLCQGYLLPVH
ncbi:MAG: glycerol-3-phosphate dehydrogenase/oxidase [Ginsengibacter sp.]